MIVADSNITAYLLIEGKYSQLARELYAADPDWIVPAIWPHEFVNILATYAKTGGLSTSDCHDAWNEAYQLWGYRIKDVNLQKAFDLAVQLELSAYDGEYVFLALEHGIPLITEDKKLLASFPEQARSLENYLKR